MPSKPTFKKEPKETGLGSIGYPHQSVRIKTGGLDCGMIYAPNWQSDGWKIQLMVEKTKPLDDGNDNCQWIWIALGKCKTEKAARHMVRLCWNRITEKYTLHLIQE